MKEFKLLRGYHNPTLMDQFERLMRDYQPVTVPTINPLWTVNPGLIQYTPPNYNITTTPGTGTYTIPLSGTINTASSISLTTSNPNGTTYTTGGFGGTLTTSTAFFTNTAKL